LSRQIILPNSKTISSNGISTGQQPTTGNPSTAYWIHRPTTMMKQDIVAEWTMSHVVTVQYRHFVSHVKFKFFWNSPHRTWMPPIEIDQHNRLVLPTSFETIETT
jgi:hypothetical protein